ncbi:MAG TPA: VOC family protein [Bordetella sp.]|jgi:catechol 2,3-dioxygenase-like lactoylglutathione lyase family enzyme|nr:VOC family protein [Bordetella sp.]
MPHINHIAIKVASIAESSVLYQDVFGFKHVSTVESVGRTSYHLSDGSFFVTLIQYDSEDSPEADFAGPGGCIHHFGIVVDDPEKYEKALHAHGCEILSGTAAKLPVKFRPSAGVVAELLVEDSIKPDAK